MKYTIITGEKSGDLHGAKLIQQIRVLDSKAKVQYTGGENLDKVGDQKILNIDKMAFMGFFEVVANLGNIYSNVTLIKKSIKDFKPDVIIFVDYAGMNLRLAKWAKGLGFKTVYYILPKAWAWKSARANIIADNIDLALSIFPFEIPFYNSYGVNAKFVGNPSYESFKEFKLDPAFKKRHHIAKPILALIPGSRAQEVKRNLKVMVEAASSFPEFQIVISKVSNLPDSIYPKNKQLIITEDFNNIIAHAEYAYVTSGTASLDIGIAGVPQVVIYKSSWLSMTIAKAMVKIKYVSLVNLLCNRKVVTELIQEEANKDALTKSMRMLMQEDIVTRANKYEELYTKLTANKSDKSPAEMVIQLL